MKDVTALGELLIDFTPSGRGEQDNPMFEANPGGAPSNVLVALAWLGLETAFIGCVGKDNFGQLLVDALRSKGVDTSGIVYSDVKTTIAFVHIDEHGERSFDFYRQPGADMMLAKEDIDLKLISQSRIFHVGSISMTDEPVREATLMTLKHAKEKGKVISFDPNLRPLLWDNLDHAKRQIETVMQYADIVKVSEEELAFLTGEEDISRGAGQLFEKNSLSLLFVTVGDKGSYAYNANGFVFVPGIAVKAVDTTGCGDAFFAGVLYQLLKSDRLSESLAKDELEFILQFGNAMGAFVAKHKGGIPAMPTLLQIEEFIAEVYSTG
ncbi:carbohydrate kinase family protein [Metabacillus malikii]|uniref:Sugar/nucleoside kinase (Ribokinase family) n=1 Tax=Metabacillus malikii TaxID=1504265 RepID=A0ABT9ZMF1_9BACI|nr:carbohydrate kinase [Metabacillus malikii]MDQ0233089.1 sugar/nucleoside kinase (ribokinase family) [Metabacillus malikii]